MAGDLRMAKAVSRITVELERAGDESKKIATLRRCALAKGEPQGPVQRGRAIPAAHGGSHDRHAARCGARAG